MHVTDLPPSKFVARVGVDSPHLLRRILEHVCGETIYFTNSTAVRGENYSIRLLSSQSFLGSVAHSPPLPCSIAAEELVRLMKSEGRYDPQTKHGSSKGLEIRLLKIGDAQVVLAQAVWVS